MKKLALLILSASLAVAQSVNVQKTSGTNAITGSLVIGDGKTLTATGNGTIVATSAASVSGNVTVGAGSTLTVNGVMTGTPTSGALSLANLTLTLPTSPTFAGVWTGAQGGTGVANTGKTITLGGNVTTVGAFNLGISLSGNTSVSFPTTGTLATLAGSETFTNKSISLGSNTLTGTSAQLATAISDETGSGALVFGTSPMLTTPVLGVATATSITGATDLTLTGGSSGASLVLGSGASGTGTLSINTRAVRMASASGYTGASDIVTGGAAWLFTHPTSGVYIDGLYSYTGTGSVNNLFIGARDELVFGSGGSGAADSIPDRMRLKATGNLLLNTTTDASSLTGGLVLNGSGAGAVASSTTTGTLRVAGGAGISGALYSSTVTTSGRLQVGSSLTSYIAEISESAASVTGLRAQNGSSSASAYSQLAINASGNSWGIRMGSTAANSNALEFISDITAPTVRFSMTPAGAATFAGAVTHTLGTNYPPQTAPASPASGWVLYTDSGDGNKLKAKASTGTVVTIGTP